MRKIGGRSAVDYVRRAKLRSNAKNDRLFELRREIEMRLAVRYLAIISGCFARGASDELIGEANVDAELYASRINGLRGIRAFPPRDLFLRSRVNRDGISRWIPS
jgi:hypothetical protein